jgi:hypothetical protein
MALPCWDGAFYADLVFRQHLLKVNLKHVESGELSTKLLKP